MPRRTPVGIARPAAMPKVSYQRLFGRQLRLQYRNIKPRVTPDEEGLIRQRMMFSPPVEDSTHDLERATPLAAIHRFRRPCVARRLPWPRARGRLGICKEHAYDTSTASTRPMICSRGRVAQSIHCRYWGIGRAKQCCKRPRLLAMTIGAAKPNLRVKLGGS